jgi:hypothetical protein
MQVHATLPKQIRDQAPTSCRKAIGRIALTRQSLSVPFAFQGRRAGIRSCGRFVIKGRGVSYSLLLVFVATLFPLCAHPQIVNSNNLTTIPTPGTGHDLTSYGSRRMRSEGRLYLSSSRYGAKDRVRG